MTKFWVPDAFRPNNDEEAEEHRQRLLRNFQMAFPDREVTVTYNLPGFSKPGEIKDALHIFEGQSGRVHVCEDRVILERRKPSCLNFFSSFPRESKSIPIDSIRAIQLSPPEKLGRSGFIHFVVIGGKENISRVAEARTDENCVSFVGRQLMPSAQKVQDLIHDMKRRSAIGSLFVADEIRKLKDLLDEGVLTLAEFEFQKKKLLES